LNGIACPTTSTCYAVGRATFDPALGYRGVAVTITNGMPGGAQPVAGTAYLFGIACPTVTTCYAVGGNSPDQGPVVTITNGIPGTPKYAGGDIFVLGSIACTTSSTCYAVSSNLSGHGLVVPVTNGTPGSIQVVPDTSDLFGIACPSTSTCYAVGVNGPEQAVLVTITAGTVGAAQLLPGITQLYGIACPGSTCYAVGTAPDILPTIVVPITDGTPGTPQDSHRVFTSISCASNSVCVGTSDVGGVGQITNGTAGTHQDVQGVTRVFPGGVACPNSTTCLVTGFRAICNCPEGQGILASVSLDTTPPVLSLPGDIVVDATGPGGASVPYSVSAFDPDDTLTPDCTPASGSLFLVGTTTVHCSVIDPGGNTDTDSFTVTVQGAVQQVSDLLTVVSTGAGPGSSLAAKVQAALNGLQNGNTALACSTLQAFINEVQAQSGKKLTTAQANALIAAATRIRAVAGC